MPYGQPKDQIIKQKQYCNKVNRLKKKNKKVSYKCCNLFSEFVSNMGVHAELLQLGSTLFNPMNFRPPGFSVHGISQARILEWDAILSSRESSRPRDPT